MPSVQQTAALRGLRPVAKALGASVGRDVQAGHGLAGGGGELADHAVERGRLELADGAGAHGAQSQLVAVPVGVRVGAERDDERDDQARTAEEAADDEDECGQSPEEYGGLQPVVPAVHGTPSKWCGRGTLCVVCSTLQWTLLYWSTPGEGR